MRVTNVELHCDLPPAEANDLAADAGAFLGGVSQYLQVAPPSPRVYVFRNGRSLRLYLRRACPVFSERTGACFKTDDGGLVVAVSAGPGGRPDPHDLRHELTHAVLAARFAPPMPWLDEGLAQLFENGCPPGVDDNRLARLRRMGTGLDGRLVELVSKERHAQLDGTDYLVAWGVTWFLLNDRAFGRKKLLRCLEPGLLSEKAAHRFRRNLGETPQALAQRFCQFVRTASP